MERLSVLVGAGALTDMCPQSSTYAITKAVKEIKNDSFYESVFVEELINKIVDILEQNKESECNFEEILYALEIITSYSSDNPQRHIGRWLLELKESIKDIEQFNLYIAKEKILQTIATIVDACSLSIYQKQLHDPNNWYNQFWLNISKSIISDIVTLNYDYSIENILKRDIYEDGFSNSGEGYLTFNPSSIITTEKIRLLHLHGCVTYGYPDLNIFPKTYVLLDLVNHGEFGGKEAIQTWQAFSHTAQSGENLLIGPIISGLRKTDKLIYYPFNIYQSLLNTTFSQNKKILIIGYSFNDEHINHLIERYIRKENYKIVLITKLSSPKLKKDDGKLNEFIINVMRDSMNIFEIEQYMEETKLIEPLVSKNKNVYIYPCGFEVAAKRNTDMILNILR